MSALPLSDVRVLDLTRLLPGGFCSLLLADLGAEVLKVEDTGAGDYTRMTPPDYARGPGRITKEDLAPHIIPYQTAYVCGSAGFADAASHLLVELGVPVHQIRVERFGPTS